MKVIKLTNLDKKPIYLNIDMIGHFYEVEGKKSYGSVDKPKHTRIGVTTHNNGGFSVTESVDKILKLITE